MGNLLLSIVGVIILLIIYMLYKITILINIVRTFNSEGKVEALEIEDRTSGSNINGILMLLFLVLGGIGAVWSSISYFDLYNIPVASDHGLKIDKMFWITMIITGSAFVITHILLFYFSFKYRFKKDGKAYYYHENNKLELIWTLLPTIVLTILVLYGLKIWNNITDIAPREAEVVEIMGAQFAWRVRYPGEDSNLGKYDYRKIDASNSFGIDLSDKNSHDDFVPREIHLPKGKPVLLKIRARDVLHSVYMLHFRLKMDAVPGMPTQFWFVPNKSTEEMRIETKNPEFNYELACAEICGSGHFSMRMIVVVDEPDVYEEWKKSQNTWLSENIEYLSQVPDELKEAAILSANIKESELVNSSLIRN